MFEELRIQFVVTKTLTPQPNAALITVHNVDLSQRNTLGTTGDVAILQAGFKQDPTNIRTLCEMDVVDVQSVIDPPSVSTVLACQDGANARKTVKLAPSYKGGTKAKDIIGDIVKSAGLVLRDMSEVVDDTFHNGFSEAGPLADLLDKLAGKVGARWSFQNGEVQFSNLDQPTEASVIVLNDNTGLITTQRRNKVGAPDTPGQKDGWVAHALLLPIVEPGARVKLETDQVNAIFKVAAVSHKGDTEGDEYFTDMELEEF